MNPYSLSHRPEKRAAAIRRVNLVMSHAEDLAQRYIHIWNETDPASRRAQIARTLDREWQALCPDP
jgi:hypothetical protein